MWERKTKSKCTRIINERTNWVIWYFIHSTRKKRLVSVLFEIKWICQCTHTYTQSLVDVLNQVKFNYQMFMTKIIIFTGCRFLILESEIIGWWLVKGKEKEFFFYFILYQMIFWRHFCIFFFFFFFVEKSDDYSMIIVYKTRHDNANDDDDDVLCRAAVVVVLYLWAFFLLCFGKFVNF